MQGRPRFIRNGKRGRPAKVWTGKYYRKVGRKVKKLPTTATTTTTTAAAAAAAAAAASPPSPAPSINTTTTTCSSSCSSSVSRSSGVSLQEPTDYWFLEAEQCKYGFSAASWKANDLQIVQPPGIQNFLGSGYYGCVFKVLYKGTPTALKITICRTTDQQDAHEKECSWFKLASQYGVSPAFRCSDIVPGFICEAESYSGHRGRTNGAVTLGILVSELWPSRNLYYWGNWRKPRLAVIEFTETMHKFGKRLQEFEDKCHIFNSDIAARNIVVKGEIRKGLVTSVAICDWGKCKLIPSSTKQQQKQLSYSSIVTLTTKVLANNAL
jgi:hypothetical protein